MKAEQFSSVWDAIENDREVAASLKARSELMLALQAIVRRWDVSQTEAARRLAITQPRLSDLLRGRIEKFSLDALFDLLARAGRQVSVKVRAAA